MTLGNFISTKPIGRRSLWVALGALGVSLPRWAVAASLPSPASLPQALAAALGQGQPLLVMVSLEGCPFCKIALNNYLLPLRQQQGLPMVQVDMRGRQRIVGFSGPEQTQEALCRSWGIKVAPTLLFFGRDATEVADRLVGASLPDFYGAYLDDRVRTAQASLRK